MSDDNKAAVTIPKDAAAVRHFHQGAPRFVIFIAVAIVVAFVMVVVSMHLYQISGAAQLDLSRPSYEDVRSEAQPMKIDDFSSSGPIDKANLDKFKKTYDDTSQKILKKQQSYGAEAISDQTLGISVN